MLAPAAVAAAYRDALSAFPEMSLALCGAPSAPRETASLAAPDVAIVADVPEAREHCLRLLMAGTDLLVEPPVGDDLDTAEALARVAELTDRTLLTGGARRYAPAWQILLRALREGAIGPVRGLEAFPATKDDGPRARLARIAAALDAFERLAGPLEELRLTRDARRLETRHASGLRANADLDTPARGADRPWLLCRGDDGDLWLGSAQVLLRREDRVCVLGPGLDGPGSRPAALAELLDRRIRPFTEDGGATQLARAHAALCAAPAWRPA